MMAKDPARRPQTPGEVAEALTPFFKKAKAVGASSKPEISRVGAVFDKTQADPDAGSAAVTPRTAGETSVAESRWESLVMCQDEESAPDLVPAALAGGRSPRKMWTTVVAASLLGLVALGVLVSMLTKSQSTPESRGGAVADAPATDDQGPRARLENRAEKGPHESAPEGLTSAGSAPVSTASTAPRDIVSRPADNQRLPSTAGTTSASVGLLTAGHPLWAATRSVYIDDFKDPKSGWARGDRWNYSSGFYFVTPRDGGKANRSPFGPRTDSALEVVGRVKTSESSRRGSWVVVVNREIGGAERGFMVKINGKGELFLSPNPWEAARDFFELDPTIGPIVDPAIKPANQANRLVPVVRKRSVEIFVNSVRVCGPVPYDFDLMPSFVQLGVWDGPGDFRAEFDSMSIRG